MKKILFLFVSTLVLGLTSCSKDDDSSSSSTGLEGRWEYSQEGAIVGGQEVLAPYEHECSSQKDYTEFLAGGVMKDYYFDTNCTQDLSQGTWTKSGNSLAVNFGGEIATAEIVTLNATTLKVKIVFSGETFIQVFTRR